MYGYWGHDYWLDFGVFAKCGALKFKSPIGTHQTQGIGAHIKGSHRTSMRMIMNGVPVVPHRLTFGQNEAYCLQEAFKHLLGPSRPVFGPQTAANI